jgi:hypothetical protein
MRSSSERLSGRLGGRRVEPPPPTRSRSGALAAVLIGALALGATARAAYTLAPPEWSTVAGPPAPAAAVPAARPATAPDAALDAPHGYVDQIAVGAEAAHAPPADGRVAVGPGAPIRVSGWTAASVAPPRLASAVRAELAGKTTAGSVGRARPDVARTFGSVELGRSGYLIVLSAPRPAGTYPLRIVARGGGKTYAVGDPLTVVVR